MNDRSVLLVPVSLVRQSILFGALCLSVCPSPLFADIFELRGGGTITGKLLSDTKSELYKIQTSDGIVLEISSGKLKYNPVQPEVRKIYEKLVGSAETAELHREVSLELNKEFRDLAKAHRERVVELDPSDKSWGELGGYFRDPKTAEWIPNELIHKRKGLMKAGRGWDTPESQAILKFSEKQERSAAEIANRIDREWRNLNEKGAKGTTAAEFFRNLKDPIAIPKLEKLLNQFPRNEMLIEILTRMPGNSAIGVFLRLSMQSSNPELRNLALEVLNRTAESREIAFQYFLGILDQSMNQKGKAKINQDEYNRAASNMQGFADKRAIPTLIKAILTITEVTKTTPGVTGMSTDGGMSMGTPTVEKAKFPVQHPAALATLVDLAEGANWQYDQAKWRQWYALRYGKSNMNLRRDE